MTLNRHFNMPSTLPPGVAEAEVVVGEEVEEISPIEGVTIRTLNPPTDQRRDGQRLDTLMFRIMSKTFASTIIRMGGVLIIVLTPWCVNGPRSRQHLVKNL